MSYKYELVHIEGYSRWDHLGKEIVNDARRFHRTKKDANNALKSAIKQLRESGVPVDGPPRIDVIAINQRQGRHPTH